MGLPRVTPVGALWLGLAALLAPAIGLGMEGAAPAPPALVDSAGGFQAGDRLQATVAGETSEFLVLGTGIRLSIVRFLAWESVVSGVPSERLERVSIRPAGSVPRGAPVSLVGNHDGVPSFGIVQGLDAEGLRITSLDEPDGEAKTVAWSELRSVSRVHDRPPGYGGSPIPGDEVALRRTRGGVFRGVVEWSTMEAVGLRLPGVERPVAFPWTATEVWVCGDASAPVPLRGAIVPSPVVRPAGEASMSLDAFFGFKRLSDEWGDFRNQKEIGVSMAFGATGNPFHLLLDVRRSEAEDANDTTVRTQEVGVGVKAHGAEALWWDVGLEIVSLEVRGVGAAFRGQGVGGWLGVGILAPSRSVFRVGASVRFSFCNVRIAGTELPAGGVHFGVVVGFGFPPRAF